MPATVPASALLSLQARSHDYLPTGIPSLDRLLSGLPRGAITEITGPRSCGRTSLMHSILAAVSLRSEYCAVVDTHDAFDPDSAAKAGIDLARLVWIRCRGNAEHAIKSADFLLHGGGFGVVCLDISSVSAKILNWIPISWWFRFRLTVQDTPTIFLLLGAQPQAKSCASCWIEFRPNEPIWSGSKPFRLLRGFRSEAFVRKPGPPKAAAIEFRPNEPIGN